MDNFYDEKNKPSMTSNLVYIGTTLVVVFGLVYVVGRAWRTSQKA